MPKLTEKAKRRRRSGPSPEEKTALRGWLDRTVVAPRVDPARLSDREVGELAEFMRGTPIRELEGKALTRFEQLIARGQGLDPHHYEQQRAQARAFGEIRRIAQQALRRPPLDPEAEKDLLQTLYEQMTDRKLLASRIPILVYLLGAFQAGTIATPRASVERDTDGLNLLRCDLRWGILPGAAQADGRLRTPLLDVLEQLERTKWIRFERRGPELTIRLGARGRRVLRVDS